MQIIKRKGPKRLPAHLLPEDYEYKDVKGRVAIFDTETDPFEFGRVVKPFTCGFYIPDDEFYIDFWGDDCIDQFFYFMRSQYPDEVFTIFVHNGGNFDAYFMTKYFDENMKPFIINGRLGRIECAGYTFQDSYLMIPVALGNALKASDGGKIEIDYSKLERAGTYNDAYVQFISETQAYTWLESGYSVEYSPREYYRSEILRYQKQDCVALGTLVVGWLDMFGARLTMASAALAVLRSFHGFECMSEQMDDMMRPYYFGGRCQAFETGVVYPSEGKSFYGFDINSSYPDVMRRLEHPISATPMYEKRITSRTQFARIKAWSNGALPMRKKDGGLDFPVGVFDFYACRHEIDAGLETGTLRILWVYESIYFEYKSTFCTFIDHFYDLRIEAGYNKDEVKKLMYKLVLVSPYGKLAQDPRRYETWLYDPSEIPKPQFCSTCYAAYTAHKDKPACEVCELGTHDAHGWRLYTEQNGKYIYSRPQKLHSGAGFFNVACAASITSGARATLLRGIHAADRPIYVDTDSILCEGLDATISKTQLGAWKMEFIADKACIAGKKLYAIFSNGALVKKAHKGVRLEGSDIERICEGEVIEYPNPVPKFTLDGGAKFVTRRIRKTTGDYESGEV